MVLSLVSCPNFISDHTQTLNRSTGDHVLVHRHDTRNRLDSFSFHDKSFVESHEHPRVPKRLRNQKVQIVGSCDGLICFSKHNTDVTVRGFLIWNPSIGKVVELPPPPSTFPQIDTYLSGFGFDPESRDYKVVWSEYIESSDDQIHIFDLRKGVWRTSSSPSTARSCFYYHHAVYFHGNLHFLRVDDDTNHILVSFNLSSEVLHKTELMLDGDILGPEPRLFLLVINGLLSLGMVKRRQGHSLEDYCSVWSMKEYGVTESWTKLYTIELPYAKTFLSPLLFWENGEVLLVQRASNYSYDCDGDVLVLYNPESKKSVTILSAYRVVLMRVFTRRVWFYYEDMIS